MNRLVAQVSISLAALFCAPTFAKDCQNTDIVTNPGYFDVEFCDVPTTAPLIVSGQNQLIDDGTFAFGNGGDIGDRLINFFDSMGNLILTTNVDVYAPPARFTILEEQTSDIVADCANVGLGAACTGDVTIGEFKDFALLGYG